MKMIRKIILKQYSVDLQKEERLMHQKQINQENQNHPKCLNRSQEILKRVKAVLNLNHCLLRNRKIHFLNN